MKKWPILLVVLGLGLLGQDRQPDKRYVLRINGHVVELSVEQHGPFEQYGSGQILLRKVLAETRIVTISADEMEYNENTGEIEPRGNVHVRLTR